MKTTIQIIILVAVFAACVTMLPNAIDQSSHAGEYQKYLHEAPQWMKDEEAAKNVYRQD